jgi:uncharacterized protein (DUF3084 family)
MDITIGQDDYIGELELHLENLSKYKETADTIISNQSLVIQNREKKIQLLEDKLNLDKALIKDLNKSLNSGNKKLIGWKIATAGGCVLAISGIVTALVVALK